jgi:hypothetical protein
VTVTNSAGCISIPANVTVNAVAAAPAAPTASATQPTCTTTTGTITITAPTGTDFTYSIDGSSYQTGTTFSGLAPAGYNVTVKNAAGCISAPTGVTVNAVAAAPQHLPLLLHNRHVQQQPELSPSLHQQVPASLIALTKQLFKQAPTFSGLAPATYNVTVKNSAGLYFCTNRCYGKCNYISPATPTASVTQPTCTTTTGTITITAPTGTGFTYSIDGGSYQTITSFSGLAPATYNVTVKNNAAVFLHLQLSL